MTARPQVTRDDYPHFVEIPTRWMDNDVYGHVNNVVYYSFFDTAVNAYLIEKRVLDLEASPTIGLVVETQCQYHASIAFPDRIEVGLAVTKLGTSSVRTREELVTLSGELSADAQAVLVARDRETGRSRPLTPDERAAFESTA